MVTIDGWLSSNPALGIVLALVLLGALYCNRSALRDVTGDPDRLWRGIARLAAVLLAALVAWISIFDKWRQLINAPWRALQIFPSQRVILHPTGPGFREVTLVLLAATALMCALLFARHFGGYGLAMTGLILSLLIWVPLYTLRDRFDLGLALGYGNSHSVTDLLGYVFYLLIAWTLDLTIIFAMFIAIVTALALPVTLLLDVTRLRHPRVTGEAAEFFAAFSQRGGHTGSRP